MCHCLKIKVLSKDVPDQKFYPAIQKLSEKKIIRKEKKRLIEDRMSTPLSHIWTSPDFIFAPRVFQIWTSPDMISGLVQIQFFPL